MAQLPGFCRVQASLLAEKKKKKVDENGVALRNGTRQTVCNSICLGETLCRLAALLTAINTYYEQCG